MRPGEAFAGRTGDELKERQPPGLRFRSGTHGVGTPSPRTRGTTPTRPHRACAGLASRGLPVPAGPGASHRSGKDSPPPARTQRGKRAAAASRRRAPRLAYLHFLTTPSSPAGDGLPAPQLSSAPATAYPPLSSLPRTRAAAAPLLLPARPSPRPQGASWAEPAGSELSSEPAPASQETGAEAVRVREAGRAYKCDSEPIPGRYLIRAGLRPRSPGVEGPTAVGPKVSEVSAQEVRDRNAFQ